MLILFIKQFRTLFQASIPIVGLLRILEEQTEDKKFKQVILEIHDDVQEGASLYKAFSKHKSIFSPLYCSMLHAGNSNFLCILIVGICTASDFINDHIH